MLRNRRQYNQVRGLKSEFPEAIQLSMYSMSIFFIHISCSTHILCIGDTHIQYNQYTYAYDREKSLFNGLICSYSLSTGLVCTLQAYKVEINIRSAVKIPRGKE